MSFTIARIIPDIDEVLGIKETDEINIESDYDKDSALPSPLWDGEAVSTEEERYEEK